MDATTDTAAGSTSAAPVILRMAGITKSFPGVCALSSVDFELRRQEVHILCGENGAGKSTLMKVLAGIHPRDSGEILIDGQAAAIRGVADAARLGIAMIHQELDLLPTLTVAENLYLGREGAFLTWGLLRNRDISRAAGAAMARLRVTVDPDARVGSLGVGVQQMVAIARALEQHPRILIMDEPTAALGEEETETLFQTIRRLLGEEGISVAYISHRLAEFPRIGDRVTILRDGQAVATMEMAAASKEEMVRLMVGRKVDQFFPPRAARPGAEALRCEQLSDGARVRDVSLTLRRGEIVGLFGLIGAGRTELAQALFGATPFVSGRILLDGAPRRIRTPRDAVRAGIGMLVEDRQARGLLLKMSVADNTTLAAFHKVLAFGFLDAAREREATERLVRELNIRTPGIAQAVRHLSGGNQQKVILARWLFTESRVLIFDEPTRGIDVGAKAEIYHLMNALTDRGVAILMISSEIEEIVAMSDRILVMHEGRIAGGEVERAAANDEAIMRLATGAERRTA